MLVPRHFGVWASHAERLEAVDWGCRRKPPNLLALALSREEARKVTMLSTAEIQMLVSYRTAQKHHGRSFFWHGTSVHSFVLGINDHKDQQDFERPCKFVGNLYANGSWRLHRTTQLNITAALVLEDDQSLAIFSRIRSETGPRKTIKKSPPTPVWSVKSPEMTAGFPVAQLNYERVWIIVTV